MGLLVWVSDCYSVSVSHTGKHGFATLHDLTDGFAIVGDVTVTVLVFLTWGNIGLTHCMI